MADVYILTLGLSLAIGFALTVGLLALLVVGVALPAVLIFMRSRPRDVGLTPFGTGAAGASAVVDTRTTPMSRAPGPRSSAGKSRSKKAVAVRASVAVNTSNAW